MHVLFVIICVQDFWQEVTGIKNQTNLEKEARSQICLPATCGLGVLELSLNSPLPKPCNQA